LSVNTAAQTSTTTSFLSRAVELPRVTFNAKNEGNLHSMTSLYFSDSASEGIDVNDAFQLTPLTDTYISMFTKVGEESMLINNLPDSFDSYEMPLYVIGVRNGRYSSETINLTWNFSATLPEDISVKLVDLVSGQVIDVLNSDSYSFTLEASMAKESPVRDLNPLVTTSSEARFILKVTRGETTDIVVPSDLPSEISLSQNFPNPFNPTTSIRFELPERTEVRLAVYDLTGREVATLANGAFAPGSHSVNFSAAELSSGVYVYRLDAAGQTHTRKMTLIK
jgi:hypothetical protein